MEKKSNTGREVWEWVKAMLIAAALVFIIRHFVFSPFIVEGPSMRPNFETGERMIVNKLIYSIRKPERGEVIVFHAPEGKDYIKRVIALPGDTVQVHGDDVFVNGKKVRERYLQQQLAIASETGVPYNTGPDFPNEDYKSGKVPAGEVFVMGDNRGNSTDSRVIGYIPFKKIVGRADVIYWPVGKASFVKHH